ncbi:TlpA family protein disulfide reductase [Chryseobacterium sp. SNU WT5]|uniref:TlpA family protein disulfide reductase n=1 Tax=Chryseobacterium sp. SNU WT5 TaxID=2594269 RepID=UPI00117D8534|nr:TlpA disulfide reductase family protein [Chryseobacterium sp. SNU WT5]QDP84796.1 TlpA family protein disulfide reductase [Chryseobacterium sp. SNU WT5]
MSKYLLMLLVAFVTMSCSKKVEVTGNFAGGSPLERIEFIEASGVATLPLVNMGVDAKGNFAGSFDAPKDGMYIMTYGGKQANIYLKGGQKLNISGQAVNFPAKFTVTGDAKKNNDFLQEIQTLIQDYAGKINVQELVSKDEAAFLKGVEKIRADLDKHIDTAAKKTSPDKDVIEFKKDELNASILGLMNQYEMNHGQITQNAAFKVTKNFTDAEAKLKKEEGRLLKNQPIYRNYLLGKLSPEFQKYSEAHKVTATEPSSIEFSKFLDTKKDMSQLAKDYLLAFVISNSDINPSTTPADAAKISKLVQDKIKDVEIKKDLERIQFVISGPKIGEAAPSSKLITIEGKEFKLSDIKGKPAMVMFYASWNPYISESAMPVMKEVANFYKSKMDFVFVNLDDTKDQFTKTSNAMLSGIKGTKVYAENGMNSQIAKDLGIYGFKLPSFMVIDKDGKVASKVFYNLGDEELIKVLDKMTGLKAPEAPQGAVLQNDLVEPPMAMPETPASK